VKIHGSAETFFILAEDIDGDQFVRPLSAVRGRRAQRHHYSPNVRASWATAQLVKQFLQNKRKQANQKRKKLESGEGNARKRGRFGIGDEGESNDEHCDQNGDDREIDQDEVDDE